MHHPLYTHTYLYTHLLNVYVLSTKRVPYLIKPWCKLFIEMPFDVVSFSCTTALTRGDPQIMYHCALLLWGKLSISGIDVTFSAWCVSACEVMERKVLSLLHSLSLLVLKTSFLFAQWNFYKVSVVKKLQDENKTYQTEFYSISE